MCTSEVSSRLNIKYRVLYKFGGKRKEIRKKKMMENLVQLFNNKQQQAIQNSNLLYS